MKNLITLTLLAVSANATAAGWQQLNNPDGSMWTPKQYSNIEGAIVPVEGSVNGDLTGTIIVNAEKDAIWIDIPTTVQFEQVDAIINDSKVRTWTGIYPKNGVAYGGQLTLNTKTELVTKVDKKVEKTMSELISLSHIAEDAYDASEHRIAIQPWELPDTTTPDSHMTTVKYTRPQSVPVIYSTAIGDAMISNANPIHNNLLGCKGEITRVETLVSQTGGWNAYYFGTPSFVDNIAPSEAQCVWAVLGTAPTPF